MGKKVLVDTITKHISPDGVLRKPRSSNSRFYLDLKEGEEPYHHVIVVGEDVDTTPAEGDGENTSAGDNEVDFEKVDFKKLKADEKLEMIKACDDAEILTKWGEDESKNSGAFAAIADKLQNIELNFNNGGDGDND